MNSGSSMRRQRQRRRGRTRNGAPSGTALRGRSADARRPRPVEIAAGMSCIARAFRFNVVPTTGEGPSSIGTRERFNHSATEYRAEPACLPSHPPRIDKLPLAASYRRFYNYSMSFCKLTLLTSRPSCLRSRDTLLRPFCRFRSLYPVRLFQRESQSINDLFNGGCVIICSPFIFRGWRFE